MAVTATETIRQRIWRGYDDPGLPVGMWAGWVQATGDVSGGDVSAHLDFDPVELSPNRRAGRFYNIEQLEMSQSASGNDAAQLLLVNWSIEINGAFTNREYVAQLSTTQAGTSSLFLQNTLRRPIFLGQAAQRGVTASVRMVLDNVDSVVYIMWAEGYIWEGRSTQHPGGLRRPVDSLYGA